MTEVDSAQSANPGRCRCEPLPIYFLKPAAAGFVCRFIDVSRPHRTSMFARQERGLAVVIPAPLRRRRSLSAPLTLTPLRLSGAEQLSGTVRSSLPEEISCLSPLQSPLPCLPASTVDGSLSSTPPSLRCARSPPSSPSKMWSSSIRGLHEEPAGGLCVTPRRAMHWAFLDEPGPIWQEPDTATAVPPDLPDLPRCRTAPPRSKPFGAVAEQQAEQQASDDASSDDASSDLRPRSKPPLRPDSVWRNVTLAQLVASRPKPCAKSSKGGKGSEGVPKLRSPWPSSELSSEHTLGGQPRNSTPAVLFSPRQLERSRRSTVARKARAANAGASMRSVWTASAAYTKVISK